MIAWDMDAGCSLTSSFLKYWGCLEPLLVTFLRSWRYLGELWGSSGRPLDLQGSPWAVQGQFVMDLGCNFGGLWAHFLDKNHGLGNDFSVHALRVVSGSILLDLWSSRGPSDMTNHANSLYCRSKSRFD